MIYEGSIQVYLLQRKIAFKYLYISRFNYTGQLFS